MQTTQIMQITQTMRIMKAANLPTVQMKETMEAPTENPIRMLQKANQRINLLIIILEKTVMLLTITAADTKKEREADAKMAPAFFIS